jgi:amidohydrolase
MPHVTIDPIAAAAQIITALQSIVSRNVAPLQAAVVSVTQVHSGTAFNVIPQEAELTGTIRSFDLSIRKIVLERFEQIIRGIAESMQCKAEIETVRVTPALINNDAVAISVQETARRVLPDSELNTSPYLTMGAEDMAFMQEKVDGCYFFIGSNNKERHLDYGHHHPKFDFDEEALIYGAALMAAAAADILK